MAMTVAVGSGQDGLSRLYEPATTSFSSENPSLSIAGADSGASDKDADGNKNGEGDAGGAMSTAVIVPVMVVLAVLVVIILLLLFRTRLVRFCRIHLHQGHSAGLPRTSTDASARTVTAEQLSGTPPRTALRTGPSNANGYGNRSGSSPDDTTAAARPRFRGLSQRALRRTESGHSVRILPRYSKEAGDEELVLVRQRSESDFSEESFADVLGGTADETVEQLLSPILAATEEELDHAEARTPGISSDDDEANVITAPNLSPDHQVDRPAPADANSQTDNTDTQHTAPLPSTRGDVPSPQAGTSFAPLRTRGETPTYLEAMSSPPLPHNADDARTSGEVDLEAAVTVAAPPPHQSVRTRTNTTFRELLFRTGIVPLSLRGGGGGGDANNNAGTTSTSSWHIGAGHRQRGGTSSTSLLLQPRSSRLSMASATRHSRVHSPAPSGSALPYDHASASQSTQSISPSLMISSPIPHTAIRASFESSTLPRAGLSNDQMRFMSSSEAVNLVGIRLEEVPENKKSRRRRTGRGEELSPSRDEGLQTTTAPTVITVPSDNSDVDQGAGGEGSDFDARPSGGPPTWEQSQDERRRNEAMERRNLARPAGTMENSHDVVTISGDNDNGDDHDHIESSRGHLIVSGSEDDSGQDVHPLERASEMTDTTKGENDEQAPSAPMPKLELEPPTPITASLPMMQIAPTMVDTK